MKNVTFLLVWIFICTIKHVIAQPTPEELIGQIKGYQQSADESITALEKNSRLALKTVLGLPRYFTYKETRPGIDITNSYFKNFCKVTYADDIKNDYPYFYECFSGTVYQIIFELRSTGYYYESIYDTPIRFLEDSISLGNTADTWSGRSRIMPGGQLTVFVYDNLQYNQNKKYPFKKVTYFAPIFAATTEQWDNCDDGLGSCSNLYRKYGPVTIKRSSDSHNGTAKKSLGASKHHPYTVQQPATSAKDNVKVHSTSSATLYADAPTEVYIEDDQHADGDSISVKITTEGAQNMTSEIFEIGAPRHFSISPGDKLTIIAISEGTLPPCTVGIQYGSKRFSLKANKGETMSITIVSP